MENEKPEPSIEVADIIGGYFDGNYMAVVHYKGDVFGIKETDERQLLGSIKIAVEKRSKANDLRRSANND
jgi:hypothetical protein